MIKYFYQLTPEEYGKVVATKITWGECATLYPQPDWCNYPGAICWVMGCWSLMSHLIHSRKDCIKCEYYIKQSRRKK